MSLRRRILYLLIVTGFLFLIVNIHQKAIWAQTFRTGLEILPGKRSSSNFKKTKNLLGDLYNKENEIDGTRSVGEDEDNDYTDSQRQKREISHSSSSNLEKPWFMNGGTRRPTPAPVDQTTGKRLAQLWPHEDKNDDRIINQLMFVPPKHKRHKRKKIKTILFYLGLRRWKKIGPKYDTTKTGSWTVRPGRKVFLDLKCPVNTCSLTGNKAAAATADAILFREHLHLPNHVRSPNQIWIMFYLECPYNTHHIKHKNFINWTATYRSDSDIVIPYERWLYYDPKVKQKPFVDYNYAANKTKSVAWFVSNCDATNNRLQYAKELNKYIPVDIYGRCGKKRCHRMDKKDRCFKMLKRDYKFYLAFENSNCREYITEKLFSNSYRYDVLPIVMGAHPEDYAKHAPEHSYIHVDEFKSPKELASYLHKIDGDDDLYNSYFRWKGTGEFIDNYFFCRLCAMLHDDYPAKHYVDINKWWNGSRPCTRHSWKNF